MTSGYEENYVKKNLVASSDITERDLCEVCYEHSTAGEGTHSQSVCSYYIHHYLFLKPQDCQNHYYTWFSAHVCYHLILYHLSQKCSLMLLWIQFWKMSLLTQKPFHWNFHIHHSHFWPKDHSSNPTIHKGEVIDLSDYELWLSRDFYNHWGELLSFHPLMATRPGLEADLKNHEEELAVLIKVLTCQHKNLFCIGNICVWHSTYALILKI